VKSFLFILLFIYRLVPASLCGEQILRGIQEFEVRVNIILMVYEFTLATSASSENIE